MVRTPKLVSKLVQGWARSASCILGPTDTGVKKQSLHHVALIAISSLIMYAHAACSMQHARFFVSENLIGSLEGARMKRITQD